MAIDKMPSGDYEPYTNYINTAINADAINIPITITGDTVSWVCGNGDSTSFCGSNESGVKVVFYRIDDRIISMPN